MAKDSKKEMKQGLNKISMVGIVKEKHLEHDTDDNGENVIKGKLVITVNKDGEIHEFDLNMYSKEFTQKGDPNKMYKAFNTIMEEYKDADTYGEEADTVEVNAKLDVNEYYSEEKDKVFVSNRIRPISITRVSKDSEHYAEIVFKGVIVGTKDEVDKEGIETGALSVQAFIVGWKETVICPVGLRVPEDLVEPFNDYASEGCTAKISADLMRGVVYKEPDNSNGFSRRTSKADVAYKNYKASIDIFGIAVDENGYTEEEIEKMKKIRKKKQATIKGEADIDEGRGFNAKRDKAPKEDIEEDDFPF